MCLIREVLLSKNPNTLNTDWWNFKVVKLDFKTEPHIKSK